MYFYEKELSRKLEDKTHELLHLLEEKKDCLLKELSGVDKITLTKLRFLMDDYYNAENRLSEYVQNYKKELTVAQGTISREFEKMKSDIEAETAKTETAFTSDLAKIRSDFENELIQYCNSYLMEDYTREVIARIAEESTPYSVVQTTGNSTTQVMSQDATTRELVKLSEEKVDKDAEPIPINADINMYTEIGNYRVADVETAQTVSNLPIVKSGRLTVYETSNTEHINQEYTTIGTGDAFGKYYRSCDKGVWSEWHMAVDLELLKSTSFMIESDKCENIVAETDLNDITEKGNYRILSAAVAKTVKNIPIAISGRLSVMELTNDTHIAQIFVCAATTLQMYIRNYNSGVWTEWFKVATNAQIDTLTDSISDINKALANTLKSTNLTVTDGNSSNYFTDFNDIPMNTVYKIEYGHNLLNAPKGLKTINYIGDTFGVTGGIVVTIGSHPSSGVSTRFQIFFAGEYTIGQSIIHFRFAYPIGGKLRWYPWQQYSEKTTVCGTNIAVRKERAAELMPDMNDAPINTIYQIDLDCDEGTILNHPAPGKSCILITTGFSHVTRHALKQECFGIDGDPFMYFRYGYRQNADTYLWTPWKKVVTE